MKCGEEKQFKMRINRVLPKDETCYRPLPFKTRFAGENAECSEDVSRRKMFNMEERRAALGMFETSLGIEAFVWGCGWGARLRPRNVA